MTSKFDIKELNDRLKNGGTLTEEEEEFYLKATGMTNDQYSLNTIIAITDNKDEHLLID